MEVRRLIGCMEVVYFARLIYARRDSVGLNPTAKMMITI